MLSDNIITRWDLMDKKYCDQCGKELDVSAQFCNSCGAPVSYGGQSKKTVGAKLDDIIDSAKSDKSGLLNVKVLLVAVIVLLAIVILFLVFSSGFASDLVDVTGVSLNHKYFYATTTSGQTSDQRPIKGTIEFSFMPTEYLDRVTGIGLQNIQITYSDGQVQNAGYGVFNSHENVYNPHQEYSYNMNYVVDLYSSADDNINAYFQTTHVKAEIIINTTSETNKVVGHIDSDVVPPSK